LYKKLLKLDIPTSSDNLDDIWDVFSGHSVVLFVVVKNNQYFCNVFVLSHIAVYCNMYIRLVYAIEIVMLLKFWYPVLNSVFYDKI